MGSISGMQVYLSRDNSVNMIYLTDKRKEKEHDSYIDRCKESNLLELTFTNSKPQQDKFRKTFLI